MHSSRPYGAAVLALLAIGAGPSQTPTRSPFDLASARIIDLTYSFDDRTIFWPSSPFHFQLTILHRGMTPGGYFYAANSFCTAEHGGTHMDAPIHFAKGHRSLDQVPVEQLMAPAFVIDVSEKAGVDRDYRLTPSDVNAWEEEHGRIPAHAIVLLRTGWGKRWPDKKRFLGSDKPNDASDLHFPSYGKESAELLVKERHVAALGVDTASIDHGPSKDFIVHRIALGADVPGFENVANLDAVPEVGAWVIALPMKIAGGSGGPLRIVALLPR